MQQSRSQLSEQSYLANRSIQQGAQAKGLGSSGLKNLSVIQSQMAQGNAVSDLETQNSNVQRAAMDARVGLEENRSNTLRGIATQHSTDTLNADKYDMELQQKDRDLMLQLMDMAGSGASADTIAAYADILGLDLSSGVSEGGKTLQEQLDAMSPDGLDAATIDYLDRNNITWDDYVKNIGIGAGIGTAVGTPGLGTAVGALGGFLTTGVTDIVTGHNDYDYTISGKEYNFKSREEALDKFNEVFANKKYISSGQVTLGMNTSNRVKFEVKKGNKTHSFNTYKQASDFLQQGIND